MSPGNKALLVLGLLAAGCAEDPVPKPRGYFRIDLPPVSYTSWTDTATFAAEIPDYARVAIRTTRSDARWFDVRFPGQRATVHLTWSPVGDQLQALIEDAHMFKNTHQVKAARIRGERVLRPEERVFGNIYSVEGDVASPLVFYLTDSTDNFLYGALYFDARPNADSLAPVTERIRADMQRMVATLAWR
jgi:gliding motility-associated lipoprotein GldD